MQEHHQPDRRSPGEAYPGPRPDDPQRDPYEHGGPAGGDDRDDEDDRG